MCHHQVVIVQYLEHNLAKCATIVLDKCKALWGEPECAAYMQQDIT